MGWLLPASRVVKDLALGPRIAITDPAYSFEDMLLSGISIFDEP